MQSIVMEDEQMRCLRATFLTTGKGRRPTLPPMVMNNKLLYQLFLLKEEGGFPYSEVQKWMKKLLPDSTYPPERFSGRIKSVAGKISTLSEDKLSDFLHTEVDFNFISEALNAQGVTRLLDKSSFKRCIITNEMVIDLLQYTRKERISKKCLFDILKALTLAPFNMSRDFVLIQVSVIEKEYGKLLPSIRRHPFKLVAFLKESFFSVSRTVELSSIHPNEAFAPSRVPLFSGVSTLPTQSISFSVSEPFVPSPCSVSTAATPFLYYSARIPEKKAENAESETEPAQLPIKVLEDRCKTLNNQLTELSAENASLKCANSDLKNSSHNLQDELTVAKATSSNKIVRRLKRKMKVLESAVKNKDELNAKLEKAEKEKLCLQKKIVLLKRARNKYKRTKLEETENCVTATSTAHKTQICTPQKLHGIEPPLPQMFSSQIIY